MLSAKHPSMPTGPKGQKRPADAVSNAVRVMQIATGEIAEDAPKPSPAAQLGSLGGKARAASLSRKKLSEIAKKAAKTRWKKAK